MSDDLGRLGTYLRTVALGRVHEHHPTLGSTNDRALAWISEGAPHGATVTAEVQTLGRGRRGRSWVSEAGQIYASVVVRPPRVPASMGGVGLAVAVGLRRGLPQCGVGLKWPNDLLVGGRKLAGILCEARWLGDAPQLVVGFGINVHPVAGPPAVRSIATSLSEEGVSELARAPLLAAVLGELEPTLAAFFEEGFDAVRSEYESHSLVLGQQIELDDGEAGRRGATAERLAPDGALLVRFDGESELRRLDAADVHLPSY